MYSLSFHCLRCFLLFSNLIIAFIGFAVMLAYDLKVIALFAWLISHAFSANEQYFSPTTNQSTVLSAMAYLPNEQDIVVQSEPLFVCL